MEYQIFCNGELIAEFRYEGDRETCLDALQDAHPDAEFKTETEVR